MTITQHIHQLVSELEERERELDRREAELAQAAETINQSDAVQLAMRLGADEATKRVVALIDLQLEQLSRAGLNAISLRTLRKHVLSEPDTFNK
jgi:uncharacterized protein YfeS